MPGPDVRRLAAEDFSTLPPDVRRGFEKLLLVLNPHLLQVAGQLDGGLTWGNLAAVVKTITIKMPERWTAPELLHSWANYNVWYEYKVGYWRDPQGFVKFRGALAGGHYGDTAFVLPEGYRPAFPCYLLGAFGEDGAAGRVIVSANGEVAPAGAEGWLGVVSTYQSLEGLSFEASAGSAESPDGQAPIEMPPPFPVPVVCGELPGRPASVICLRCEDITNKKVLPGLEPGLSWEVAQADKPTVLLTQAANLLPGRTYRLTLLVTV